ncbi:MAG: single-stranded DNA-binding protein, partial [Amaricoccus sp.]
MNTFSDIGRVVADAELRDAGNNKVCSVRLAFDTGYGDKRGTMFLNASIWRNSEQLAPKLTKGTEVQVSGSISVRDYTTRDGGKGQSIDLAVDRVGRIRPPQDKAARSDEPLPRGHSAHPSRMEMQDEI